MELTKFLAFLAIVLPAAYGAPADTANTLHPQILEAMKRDLGLDAEQATALVARDISASSVIEKMQSTVGNSFAGGWIDGDKFFIGVTDQAAADKVTAAGATPMIVKTSLSKLETAMSALDKVFIGDGNTLEDLSTAQSGIASYFVDVATNKLVIEALADSHTQAKELALKAGLTEHEFEVRTVDSLPTTMSTVQGGNAYIINNRGRCSVGFSVKGGFLSAGHCGKKGDSVTTPNGIPLGTFEGSIFPGKDMSYIKTIPGTTLTGYVNSYGHGTLPVRGSSEVAIGAAVCRSGSTTGFHCGRITGKNSRVVYPQGTVLGLTQTNVCAEPGDSGGSFFTGDQAQGFTSGGRGNCRQGGTTYFQPVNPALETYRVSLVRA